MQVAATTTREFLAAGGTNQAGVANECWSRDFVSEAFYGRGALAGSDGHG
jgi:hypothetical protein